MAYGYVYPAPMPSPFWAPTSASIGRPTPPSSGATATDALDGLTASKDGDQELQAEPLNRTWSERRPCLIAALIGLAFSLANAAMGGLVEPGTWFSFRQAEPLTFIGPFAYSINATRTEAVWLHVHEQPAVSFWLAANAISLAASMGLIALILFARHPVSDRALRRLRSFTWLLIGLLVIGPLAASIVLAATGWTGGALGVMIQWIGLVVLLIAGCLTIRLERDPAVCDRAHVDRAARAEALIAFAEAKAARQREKERVREFHEVARDPVLYELMKQKAMRMGSG